MTAKAETHAASWAEYERWRKTPRGRFVTALRRVKAIPYRTRYALARFIYPGDLDDR